MHLYICNIHGWNSTISYCPKCMIADAVHAYDVEVIKQKIIDLENENKKLKEEKEFMLGYSDPENIKLRYTIKCFMDLPKDKQQKLIELCSVLASLAIEP